MQGLLKLWPYVRPQRRLVLVSVVTAVLAAGVWAAALMLAFPVTNVLLARESLPDLVTREIAEARAELAQETHSRNKLDAQLTALAVGQPDAERERLRLLRDRARCQDRITSASRLEWRYSFAQQWIIPRVPADRFHTLAMLFVMLLALTAVHGGLVYVQEVWIGRIVQGVMRTLRARLYRRTWRFDAQTLGREGSANLLARFTNDLAGISQGLTLLGGKVLLEPFKIIACLTAAFLFNWRLTLLSLICAPLGALLFQQFGKRLKRASRRQMETVARLYQVIQETLRSIRVVTAYGNQRHHRRLLVKENRDYYRRAIQITRLDALVNPTVELLGVFAACLAVLPAAYLVVQNQPSIWGIRLADRALGLPDLALLYSLLAGVLDPARKLSSVYSKLKKASAACDRVSEWMDQTTRVPTITHGLTLRHSRSLSFDRVSFTYHGVETAGPARPPALDDVSLDVTMNDVVAIVGGNGSGKSTLVGLLPRFFDPQHGSVKIDGVDIRELSLPALRAQLGWVPQEPLLFDRTLAENIAFGRPDATAAEIEDVARRAHVWDFAAQWPEGLQTPVGERGSRLSGGQRQRVALARAMLRDPAILILDEATSAVDVQSERLIFQALKPFTQGRTTLVITHAITPALHELLTKIVVFQTGRIVGVGSHEQLLRTCAAYQALSQARSERHAA